MHAWARLLDRVAIALTRRPKLTRAGIGELDVFDLEIFTCLQNIYHLHMLGEL